MNGPYLIDFDPILLELGDLSISWYGILFAAGFGISRFIVKYMFQKEGRWKANSDILLIYIIVGTVIGARLGHILFYAPGYYFSNPQEIMKLWEGGLASHGTSVGILLAIGLYCYQWRCKDRRFVKTKREGYSYLQIVDRIVIVVAFGGCLIRIGNFLNAEAIGKPLSNGVVHSLPIKRDLKSHLGSIEHIQASLIDKQLIFTIHFPERIQNQETIEKYHQAIIKKRLLDNASGENPTLKGLLSSEVSYRDNHFIITSFMVPISRHAAQLYEATGYLILFLMLFSIWKINKLTLTPGRIFGLFLIGLFGSRIIWEFLKEESSAIYNGPFTMGQVLSLPFFLVGIFIIIKASQKQ